MVADARKVWVLLLIYPGVLRRVHRKMTTDRAQRHAEAMMPAKTATASPACQPRSTNSSATT
jgi:hypothetical protein